MIRHRVPPTVFRPPPPIVIPAVPALFALRAAVLARTDTRCPKWGFRLGADFAMQLQPKPVFWRPDSFRQESVRFDGLLEYRHDGQVTGNTFRVRPDWTVPRLRLQFSLVAYGDAPDSWLLSHRGLRYSKALRAIAHQVLPTLLTRLETAFTDGTFDAFRPELMLMPACLRCGKALTDPASMARWIGPECAASGALTVPRLFKTTASLLPENPNADSSGT